MKVNINSSATVSFIAGDSIQNLSTGEFKAQRSVENFNYSVMTVIEERNDLRLGGNSRQRRKKHRALSDHKIWAITHAIGLNRGISHFERKTRSNRKKVVSRGV